jgi:Swt1-like HEPN
MNRLPPSRYSEQSNELENKIRKFVLLTSSHNLTYLSLDDNLIDKKKNQCSQILFIISEVKILTKQHNIIKSFGDKGAMNYSPDNNSTSDKILKRNKELVEKVMDEQCIPFLVPFVKREMRNKYGDKWLSAIDSEFRTHHLIDGNLKWNDPQVVLKLMFDQWKAVFKKATNSNSPVATLVSELQGVRNHAKHLDFVFFDDDYTFRALDSMARLLHQSGVRVKAIELDQLKEEFRQDWHLRSQGINSGFSPEVRALRTLIAEKTTGFVGREFVFTSIDEFLKSQPNGYFIIEADPGVGKTALLAEYVRKEMCVAHFNIRSQGINRADQFLDSICQQLIDTYKLPYSALPIDANRDGKFLSKLLQEVSIILKPKQQLVIAIDALDEVDASDHLGGNLLYLPATLPEKVYFVLTQRSIPIALSTNSPIQRFLLMQYVNESRQDVQAYLQQRIENSLVIQAWVFQQQQTIENFVTELTQRSENNFMYLRYVLSELDRGTYQNTSLAGLPQGLESYYEDHWRRMGMTEQSRPRYKVKIVYVLAELKEPISRPLIAEFAQEDALTVQEVLDRWQEFLREESIDGQTCYSIYHASFSDFLYRKDIVQAAGDLLNQVKRQITDDLWNGLYG